MAKILRLGDLLSFAGNLHWRLESGISAVAEREAGDDHLPQGPALASTACSLG